MRFLDPLGSTFPALPLRLKIFVVAFLATLPRQTCTPTIKGPGQLSSCDNRPLYNYEPLALQGGGELIEHVGPLSRFDGLFIAEEHSWLEAPYWRPLTGPKEESKCHVCGNEHNL